MWGKKKEEILLYELLLFHYFYYLCFDEAMNSIQLSLILYLPLIQKIKNEPPPKKKKTYTICSFLIKIFFSGFASTSKLKEIQQCMWQGIESLMQFFFFFFFWVGIKNIY